MRICLIGHSFVHMRQWIFGRELAAQGHQVLMVCPERWHHLGVTSHDGPGYSVRALPTTSQGDIYHFEMKGVRDIVAKFRPHWLYVQQEAQSDLARDAAHWDEIEGRRALFVWENIHHPDLRAQQVLGRYDLVVTGNLEAYEIARPWTTRPPVILPQVGICPDLFKPLPKVTRTVDVAFFGRPVPEKGVEYLMRAWPAARVMSGANYDELTEPYNQAQVVVCYSQDVLPTWKEQAMPYVAAEALFCGTPVICSNTASSLFWLLGCPAVRFVPQGRPDLLQHTIAEVLRNPPPSGREWAVSRFSNQAVSRKLVDAFWRVDREYLEKTNA